MKALKIQFLMALMLIAGGWLQAQTVTVGPWTFYPSPHSGTMWGQAQINGVVAAAEDVIAAFEPDGECVGAKLMTMSSGIAYINFVIYGDDQGGGNHGMNPGENFTLKIRDSSAHCTYVYYPSLSGWQDMYGAPMPGFDNPNTIYNFLPCTLSTSTTSLSLPPSPAGTTTFNITTYCDWTISESLSWLSVSPASGTGDATITVTYDENTGAQRSGNIGVNVNCTTPVTIGATQAGDLTLNVTPANKNVTCASGTTTFDVTSNTTWTVTDNVSWLAVSPTSGSNNGTITATFSANTTGALRVATITITGAGVITPATVTVSQCPTVTPTNQIVTCAAGTTSFTVNANSTWTVSESESWLSVSPTNGTNNGTITVAYDLNTGAARTGTITVTFPDLPAVTVTVTQAAVCTLTVTPANQTVPATPGGTTTFTITSACAWTVAESETWLSVSPTSGTGNDTITVTYPANTGGQRVGTIIVSVPCAASVPITVTQTWDCPLTVTPANQNVTAISGSTAFTVTTTCAWTAVSNQTWCTVTATGTGNGTITANYTANSTAPSIQRVANITVTVSGGTPVVVTVTQAAAFISVTPANRDVTSASGSTTFAVTSNTTWTVSDNVTWLSAAPASGSNNGTITATYSANTGIARIATITVTGAGVTPATTVTVTQAAPVVTRTITVASQNPASGVAITVSPADNSGNGNGTTQFTRVYNDATSVTLTASATAGSNVFQKWQKNGADFSTNLLINFSATAADTYTAFYNPPSLTVTLPDTTVMAGTVLELPVYVGNLTGLNILAFQFSFTFDQTVILPVDPYIITTGTISSQAGWSVIPNPNVPGQMTIGGIGTEPLVGGGILLAIKFNVIGTYGEVSPLDLTSFTFNDGVLSVTLTDGSVTIPPKVCGDADQNNLIQAYDAALTLQHAIGLIVLPAQGILNADVFEDDVITAWDATLILRHSIGLPMPANVTTCFGATYGFAPELPKNYEFGARLLNMIHSGKQTSADIILRGINETGKVFAVSFDLTSSKANIQNLTMPNLPNGYLMFMNPTNSHNYRVGIINTNGVLTDDMTLHILMSGFNSATPLSISNILLNDEAMPDIRISGNTNTENLITGSLVAYPNPFNASTNITYQVIEDSPVQLEIFDMFGRKVKTLVSESLDKGFYNAVWNGESNTGSRLQQGWYIVRLKSAGSYEQIKVNLIY